MFVSLHGSWDKLVPSGYQVAMLPFDKHMPTKGFDTLFSHANYQTACVGNGAAR